MSQLVMMKLVLHKFLEFKMLLLLIELNRLIWQILLEMVHLMVKMKVAALLLLLLLMLLPKNPRKKGKLLNLLPDLQQLPNHQPGAAQDSKETRPKAKRVANDKQHYTWVLSNCVDSFSSAYLAHQKNYLLTSKKTKEKLAENCVFMYLLVSLQMQVH